jgi:hypothetical protein
MTDLSQRLAWLKRADTSRKNSEGEADVSVPQSSVVG